jgi:hypothetical protein
VVKFARRSTKKNVMRQTNACKTTTIRIHACSSKSSGRLAAGQTGMAHVLCKSAFRPLTVSVWQSKSNVSVLPSVSQLTTLRILCAPPALTSLREWHAKQHPWSLSKSQNPNRAFSKAAAPPAAAPDTRPKVVFLGTPEVINSRKLKLLLSRSVF